MKTVFYMCMVLMTIYFIVMGVCMILKYGFSILSALMILGSAFIGLLCIMELTKRIGKKQ